MKNSSSKKILVLGTSDKGGAAEYCYKLACLLKDQGNEVVLYVNHKSKNDDFIIEHKVDVIKKTILEKIKLKIIKKYNKLNPPEILKLDDKYCYFGINETVSTINPEKIINHIGFVPEFIFSGWTAGFLNSTDLLLLQQYSKAKLYTISVDMNHLTGGCHYAWDCKGFINGCSSDCPAILSEGYKDLAKINFEAKLNNAHLGNFKIISGSGWTLKQAQESKIYKNQDFFPNLNSLIDTQLMKLTSKKIAKEYFNLDSEKFYILMGCQYGNEPRKGFEYLLESLQITYSKLNVEEREKINVLIVSSDKVNSFDEIPFEKTHIEYITDYKVLSLLYQAVDVFVNSSVEDSGPMMVSEALACGTPVVGFDMGVVNNLVITGFNGYKARLKESNDLAQGILDIYKLSPTEYKNYSNNAIDHIQKYSSFEYAITVLNNILNQ